MRVNARGRLTGLWSMVAENLLGIDLGKEVWPPFKRRLASLV